MEHWDEAGVVTIERVRLQGKRPREDRETINPQQMIDAVEAASSANGYVVDTFRVDWTLASGESVASKKRPARRQRLLPVPRPSSTPSTAPSAVMYPKDVDGRRKSLVPTYNSAGALQSVVFGGWAVRRLHRLQRQGQRTSPRWLTG